MGIDNGAVDASASGQVPPSGEPLRMTEGEKRAAEWEARHDVAARGHRAGPDVLQHYFAHERLTHTAEPHPARAPHAPEPQQPVRPPSPAPASGVRSRLRRLFHRH